MESKQVKEYVDLLALYESSECVFNPYLESDSRHNLTIYLETLISLKPLPFLFVGEAPGYKGCRNTGIPFSSEYVLRSEIHPFILNTRKSFLIKGRQKEPSGCINRDRLIISNWSKFVNECCCFPRIIP